MSRQVQTTRKHQKNLQVPAAQVYPIRSIPSPHWRTKMVATVRITVQLKPCQGVDKVVSKKEKPDNPHYRQAPSVEKLSTRACQGRGRSDHPFSYVLSAVCCSPSLRRHWSQRILLRLWQSRCYREFGPGFFNVRIFGVDVPRLSTNLET